MNSVKPEVDVNTGWQPRSLAQVFSDHQGNVSDKWEQYLGIYEMVLAPRVALGRPLRLLEIGVQNGGSLQIWTKYLPPGSTVLGLDIDPACSRLDLGPSITVKIGDASSPEELDRLVGDGKFDVIIDDGSHRSEHIISTFKATFPRLAGGGIYIIEDLHASYITELGGGFRRPDAAIEWLKWLADVVNVDYLSSEAAGELSQLVGMDMRALGTEVTRVSWFDSVAVIEKASQPRVAPFRRVMSGTVASVSSLDQHFKDLPVTQLRSLVLSPSAIEAFGSLIVSQLADANERLNVASQSEAWLKEQVRDLNARAVNAAHESGVVGAKLEAIGDAFKRVKGDAERSAQRAHIAEEQLGRLQLHFETVSAELNSARLRADVAEALAQSVLRSTTWMATSPVRAVGKRLPLSVRTVIRRTAKLGWWIGTGQLGTKLRARRDAINTAGLPGGVLSAPISAVVDVADENRSADDPYMRWCEKNTVSKSGLQLQRRISASFHRRPVFSIVVPVFKTPVDVFESMVQSVVNQSYDQWELCLVVVNTGAGARELIDKAVGFGAGDGRVRVKVVESNLGISGNSNAALEIVSGDWIVLLDHDDELSSDALFELARAINANEDAVFVYSDKDMLSRDGVHRFNPLLKPAWSRDMMLNANYLTHVCAMPTWRVREIGGWDPDTDGAQDWDLFLRVIGGSERVVHVPKVLYHWRVIETSVSSGGLDVKPYAAEGQLRALLKYLPVAGWPNSKPTFESGQIRISWKDDWPSNILLLVCGGEIGADHIAAASDLGASLERVHGDSLCSRIDEAIARTEAETIVLIDGDYSLITPLSARELVGPLSNPAIAMVAGRVLSNDDHLIEFGVFFDDGIGYPGFRGQPQHYYIPGGSTGWYRNASAASGGAIAFRRENWSLVGGLQAFADQGRPDIAFSLAMGQASEKRILLNPFATFRASKNACLFERQSKSPIAQSFVQRMLPFGDPFVNSSWDIKSQPGVPALPPSRPLTAIPSGHDFSAEARYVVSDFDATADEINESIASCKASSSGPLKSMAWFVPAFTVAFYGGIHTILRAAEHMRLHHGVKPIFIILGDLDANTARCRVRLAFPDLAINAEFFSMSGPRSMIPELGPLDAAIATLWTTAFPLLRLTNVRRKFYFVQDWEPLFYPAGSISAMVEATYRFGFHAVCNTPSLAAGYRELGGVADHFIPAVDTTVFHDRGRPARKASSPFVLVSYARPGAPRNCFESLVEAFKLLKKNYGSRLEIVTAGQAWNPDAYGLQGIINNLGLLSYEETGALYRAADAGLVAMATRHPSYLPFELMACGAAVITNRNSMTEWLLRDGDNCLLCEMTVSDIFEKVQRLIEDEQLRGAVANNAKQDISSAYSSWDSTCEKIYKITSTQCEGVQ